jgi:PAS domain-containing protein
VFWGDQNAVVYNEAYTQLIGRKHPAMQGQNPCVQLAEVWDYFKAILDEQKETSLGVVQDNAFLLLQRHGFDEECYFSWKFVPIVGDEGYIIASHATVIENTREVLIDRRMSVVRSLTAELCNVRTIQDLWYYLIRALELAENDAPLCLLYSASASSEVAASPSTTLSNTSSMPCVLEGSIGIPAEHSIAPAKFDACSQKNWLSSAFKKAMNSMEQILIPLGEEERKSLTGIQWKGFGEPTHVAVCPLISTESKNLLAFLVIGLNPRRPFDDDYRAWVQFLTEQVTTPQISAVILRQEVDRRRTIATQEAIDRASLSRKLSESETRFARFATRAPIGLAILTADGEALITNDLWRQFTALDVGSDKPSWDTILMPGEFAHLTSVWEQVVKGKKPLQLHTRLDIPWKAPDLTPDGKEQWTETHLLLDLHPDFDDEGNVSTIMSCISNISGIKWSENQLRAKMEQALEMKKQQERFIDVRIKMREDGENSTKFELDDFT